MLKYTDSEVNKFHPICSKALVKAINNLGLNNQYKAVHHQTTGTLEMDFVVENITTGKYLCVIEVKRTPSAVNSTRYQYQAMSYVQNNVGLTEKPFYILTNLEVAYSFKFDSLRPKPFLQILDPGLEKVSSIVVDDETAMENKMACYFENKLKAFITNSYSYQMNLGTFAMHMEAQMNDSKAWKTHLAVLLYEYIRGSFNNVKRSDLRDIRIFGQNVQQICNEAAKVDFKAIFDYSTQLFYPSLNVADSELVELFNLGDQNVSGDSVANILHAMVSSGHEHEGEVPTDIELGRLVATLAKNTKGSISPNDIVCDPAAGSGNLISSSIDIMGLLPNQIIANDINPKLIELLALRLGLNYAKTVGPTNAPFVLNKDITTMNKTDLSDVSIVVMNPPYVAGINCVNRKLPFYSSIKKLTGADAMTNIGQMPLESVFLELVTELLKPGTTIACVFPINSLMARGDEAIKTREMILKKMGLSTIFIYPGEDVFTGVVKSTCVLVGKTKTVSNAVNIISSYTKVPDIDILKFESILRPSYPNSFTSIMPGIQAVSIPTQVLTKDLTNGWRYLDQEKQNAIVYIDSMFMNNNRFTLLGNTPYKMKRGGAGNTGGSDLLFLCDELYNKYSGNGLITSAAMRNAKLGRFLVGNGDSRFFDAKQNSNQIIDSIVTDYISLAAAKAAKTKSKGQPVAIKTKDKWIDILNKESKHSFPANSVLIPRACRSGGNIFLAETPVFVSTNFLVCSMSSNNEALLLGSWMTTIFYQLMCELSSKNEDGMRKMEIADFCETYIPVLSSVSASTIQSLTAIKGSIAFLNLHNPQIRDVDTIWANELFGKNATQVLNDSLNLLTSLACLREK